MGLSVVHGLVKNLHGHISVESAHGSGTAFSITIPEYRILTASDDISDSPSFRAGSGHILFVDDEVSITKILKEFLEHLGYTVTVQANALAALEAFRSDPQNFDCLITDQTMPTLGGDRLAREFLKIRPHMPIILFTGFSHAIDEEKAIEQGITAFLYKPLSLDQLSQTVASVLSRSKSDES
jgi:DNA-binding NtrC family response regulator